MLWSSGEKKTVEHAYRYENIGCEAMCLSPTSCVQSNVTDTGTTRTVADAINFWESSSEADIKYCIKNNSKTTNYIRFIFVGKNVISLPLSLVGASFCAFHCGIFVHLVQGSLFLKTNTFLTLSFISQSWATWQRRQPSIGRSLMSPSQQKTKTSLLLGRLRPRQPLRRSAQCSCRAIKWVRGSITATSLEKLLGQGYKGKDVGAAASQRRFLYFGMRMVPTAYCHLAIASELQVSCFMICNPAFAGCARWQYGVGTIVIPKHRNRRWLVVAATPFPLYSCLNNFSREPAVIEPRARLIARHEHCALRWGSVIWKFWRIVSFKVFRSCKF